MSDESMLFFGEDGVARKYDDTWDITIHCESEEEQKLIWEKLNNPNREAKNSSNLISRQAAIDAICKCTDIYVNNLPTMIDKAEAYKAISELPPAQPEIVRCKDCEYGKQDEVGRWFCWSLGCQIGDEDGSGYCADAERRTDGV